MGRKRWTEPAASELRLLGFAPVVVEGVDRWVTKTAPTVAVIGDTERTLTAEVELVRQWLPHVVVLVASPVALTVMQRCALYSVGVQHVLEPPLLGVELAARIHATQIERVTRG